MADTPLITDRPATGVLRLTFNRPDKRNALSPDGIVAMTAAMEEALVDDSVRAIVLTGSGGHFCAGGDVDTMDDVGTASGRARMQRNHGLVRALVDADKPIVSAVEGFAAGAGAGIAIMADTVVMGMGAQMIFPFLRLGLVPDYGLAYTLPRRAGDGLARQLLLYGGRIDAETAGRKGLADHVVDDEAVQDKALELAGELASRAPLAMRMAKRMLAQAPAGLDAVLELEALSQTVAFVGDELPEGLAAFREKRSPEF